MNSKAKDYQQTTVDRLMSTIHHHPHLLLDYATPGERLNDVAVLRRVHPHHSHQHPQAQQDETEGATSPRQILRPHIRPAAPCPTPDYDTLSVNSTPPAIANGKPSEGASDPVEMESLESVKINSPVEAKPKPPNSYFPKRQLGAQLSNGSVSSMGTLKKSRPVSVTIGEYPSMRRQPGRLDFLQNGMDEKTNGNQPITSQLATELTQTLEQI
ncbi:hypothetical protein NQ318_004174 [Aromia moschata]|uniref:Uncharacterized protein n=1 Tax=Aromia moschata TaxID=1265417 RepID=A0AAV8XMH5_9CUCU|nr:hypothetical protein NQ318_004174 [Aromia moschata]